MDLTAIVIIVISTLAAIFFKWYLFRRIREWMDQDLIKGLANGSDQKLAYLQLKLQGLKDQGVKRRDYQTRLEHFAEEFEQN
ncbi:hypothetical protein [Marinobacterium jannaschii]|uniref:hypothetical protein n=1 Tax=Marinobacterium jannaschii TaxID=64970 RepID=UPI0004872CCF|nr:hypothetical protein [Marinobacterium jannaschii]